jgi:hypothetical protein
MAKPVRKVFPLNQINIMASSQYYPLNQNSNISNSQYYPMNQNQPFETPQYYPTNQNNNIVAALLTHYLKVADKFIVTRTQSRLS